MKDNFSYNYPFYDIIITDKQNLVTALPRVNANLKLMKIISSQQNQCQPEALSQQIK